MRHYSVIAQERGRFFFTFIFIIISPSSRHVMLIDRVGHPSWMTASIQGRRFLRPLWFFPSPVAARDLTCSFELSDVRHACRSALDCLRLCDNGHRAPIRRCGGALPFGATGHIDFLRRLDTGYYRSAKKFRAVSGKEAGLLRCLETTLFIV